MSKSILRRIFAVMLLCGIVFQLGLFANTRALADVKEISYGITEAQAKKKLEKFIKLHPDGTRWADNDDNYYASNIAWPWFIGHDGATAGYDCAGFAMMVSDYIFGDLPARRVSYDQSKEDFDKIRVGDILFWESGHAMVAREKIKSLTKDDEYLWISIHSGSKGLVGAKYGDANYRWNIGGGKAACFITRYPEVKTGWQTIDGKKYHYTDDGNLHILWETIKGKTYYFGEDGVMVTGLKNIDGKNYYFNKKGVLQKNGWITINGKKAYYAQKDGVLLTGKKIISKKTYYFDKQGALVTGKWMKIGGKYYFLNSNGQIAKGKWIKTGSNYYYATSATGERATGWQVIKGNKYHFNKNGVMQTGWRKINNKLYYFDPDTGVMVTGTQLIGTKYEVFNDAGVWQKSLE